MRYKPQTAAGAACAALIAASTSHAQAPDQPVEEVVVTGSYIERSSFDSPSPLDVVGQEEFAKQGAISVKDLAQNLTYNMGSENWPDQARSGATTGTENINLRGLGLNSTLVLMNGRRQAESPNLTNDGVAFVDTASMMPTIAIERMEILKDGAAALYGSDAISGVVNFITRNDFEGLEISVDHQFITEYDDDRPRDWSIQGITGFGNERGHVVVAASYLDRNQMPFYERDWARGGGISAFGSPGNFIPSQADGESTAAYGGRLAAYDPAIAQALAAGETPAPVADANCLDVPHAQGNTDYPMTYQLGGQCLVDFLPTQSILDEEERIKLWASFRALLVEEHEIELYGEFHAASNDMKRGNSPSYGFVNAPAVPVENPGLRYDAFQRGLGGEELIDDAVAQAQGFEDAVDAAEQNPAVGPVTFVGRPYAGIPQETTQDRSRVDTTGRIERDKTHFVTGLRGNLPVINDTWTFDVAGTWSEHQFSGFVAQDTNDQNMRFALQGLGGRDCNVRTGEPGNPDDNCYFYNPFGSNYIADEDDVGPNGLYNTTEMYDHMFDPITSTVEQEVWVIDAVATGDVMELPAGNLSLAVGGQYRNQSYHADPSGTGENFNFSFVVGQEAFSVNRDVYAVFGEARVPVTGPGSPIGALEVNTALRYEDYGGGTGDTTDPKISFLWMPTNDLSLRGSFQTSFKAPNLAQLGGSSTSVNNVPRDPFDLDGPRGFVPGIAVGNPDLVPEEADVYNLGVSYQPTDFLDGLAVNLDYWSFEYDNAIRKESNTAVLEAFVAGDPEAQEKLTLDASGQVAVIRSEFQNTAQVTTKGVDAELTYEFDVGNAGVFEPFFRATYLTEYEFQEEEGGETIDGRGKRNFQTIGAPAPKWRANAGLDWLRGNHSANLTVRHVTDYEMSNPPNELLATIQGRTPSRDIDDQTTVDLQYSYQMQELFGNRGPILSIGAINVFDDNPPSVDDGPGYDSKIHDPRGRVVYGRINVSL